MQIRLDTAKGGGAHRHADLFGGGAQSRRTRPQIRHARPERWGDVVLKRKDAPASYHLAVVVDDAFQGVTHVTRGTDMEAATDIHVLLQMLLGLPSPIYTFHQAVAGRGWAQAVEIGGCQSSQNPANRRADRPNRCGGNWGSRAVPGLAETRPRHHRHPGPETGMTFKVPGASSEKPHPARPARRAGAVAISGR